SHHRPRKIHRPEPRIEPLDIVEVLPTPRAGQPESHKMSPETLSPGGGEDTKPCVRAAALGAVGEGGWARESSHPSPSSASCRGEGRPLNPRAAPAAPGSP